MAQPEVVTYAHTWVEIGLGICGFGGIILSQWRSAIGVKNEVANVKEEIARLADEQEKSNGRIRDIEITCARTHGVRPSSSRRTGKGTHQ